MLVEKLRLPGLKKITPRLFPDLRGFFLESYQRQRYITVGIDVDFCQDNLSSSQKNTVRGLHFQSTPGQAKLVTCLQGKIWDVVVDVRKNSPTYLAWEGVILDDEAKAQLFIPIGFAHGFCVLSDTALVQYKVSSPYSPETEKTIRWNDPTIGIQWPVSDPILSPKDAQSPLFKEVFV